MNTFDKRFHKAFQALITGTTNGKTDIFRLLRLHGISEQYTSDKREDADRTLKALEAEMEATQ